MASVPREAPAAVAAQVQPLVSVVTPVYNGAAFIAECIESVLRQTHGRFEYLIVNNASTDGTLEIAREYAARDPRISVRHHAELVGVIENHNRAFAAISPESRYCKVVSADDWVFPECVEKMVALAEANPSVGIVGSYQLSGGGTDWRDWKVLNGQIAYPSTVVPGRDLCRAQLLGGPKVFGAPTALLYRADLVRRPDGFYPNVTAEADWSACYRALHDVDFGFVHQVLSCDRVHNVRQTATSAALNAYLASGIGDLLTYGTLYLSEEEVRGRLRVMLADYYRVLGRSALKLRGGDYWRYHKKRLAELGLPLSYTRLGWSVGAALTDLLLNPKASIQKLLKRS